MAPEDKNDDVEKNPVPEEPEVPTSPAPSEEPVAADSSTVSDEGGNDDEFEPSFDDLQDTSDTAEKAKKIDFLYDVKLDLDIELGRADVKVRDILNLRPGSVVELNRLAGDPVEIIVNKKLIARGEVIVIDDNFAVRVTDILTPSEIMNTIESHY